jgi:6-phospho-beta-glucosidase
VPVVLDIAERARRRAAPDAWIVDFTNPVGIVTQALLDEGHRAIGLCNVAIGVQRRFASHFGVEPERVELDHVGLNHLSWERAVRVNGVDRLPELLKGDSDWISEMMGFPADLIRSLGSIPSYYLKYYYSFDTVLAGQMDGHTRADEVIEIEAQLLDLYRDPTLKSKPALLENRGGAYYSEAAAQLVASLHDGRGDVQVVDVRNDGALAGLPDDAVVEIPARIDRDGAHPLVLEPLAPEYLGLVQQVKAYERLAIVAAMSGDRDAARIALLANPLVGRWSMATSLVDAIIEANGPYLPRFYPA